KVFNGDLARCELEAKYNRYVRDPRFINPDYVRLVLNNKFDSPCRKKLYYDIVHTCNPKSIGVMYEFFINEKINQSPLEFCYFWDRDFSNRKTIRYLSRPKVMACVKTGVFDFETLLKVATKTKPYDLEGIVFLLKL